MARQLPENWQNLRQIKPAAIVVIEKIQRAFRLAGFFFFSQVSSSCLF
ncbi:hypothetical protein CPter291_1314 [Collimonas pratensis]|uniref:Uncharacterized protein n=1 Tax=Collimonas pratensis TaxID=279113 RepID=A0ABM5Z363_9BURK|nr:hypothetical protein CPter291_1314 [Collimonas pratensis]